MNQPYGMGIIGCGMIAERYLEHAQKYHSAYLRPVACFDLDLERAQRLANAWEMQAAPTLDALLDRSDVEMVVNLSNPPGHAPATLAAIEAGKHIYSEKPIALTLDEADRIVEAAEQRGVQVAAAPAIMLGSAHQTMWALVRSGKLGRVFGASGAVMVPGPEGWHPNAHAFYGPGAGPLQDDVVYQITMLTTMFGPVREVIGMSQYAIPERIYKAGPRAGERFTIVEADHVSGLLQFESGLQATLMASFAVARTNQPALELYGSERTLWLEQVWNFAGKVHIARREGETPRRGGQWEEQPLLQPDESGVDWARGVAEFAQALREDRAPRCTVLHGRHTLEVMLGILQSAREKRPVQITRRFPLPPPLPQFEQQSGN